ncbi:MAG: hypothetical protein IJ131_07475 [Eggerthellaceae bacterium]|nr:hypothetical protein [Eggerthellaceae bacterium]
MKRYALLAASAALCLALAGCGTAGLQRGGIGRLRNRLGQGHTQAERTGTSTENFIAWVQECAA